MKKLMIIIAVAGAVSAFTFPISKSPQFFNFDGVLMDSTGVAITTSTSVDFKIMDPGGTCVLYDETQTVVPDAQGNFSVQVGSGSRVSGVDPGLGLDAIFQNNVLIRSPGGGSCSSGYTPTSADARKLRITIAGNALTPDFTMASLPFSIVAQTLQGLYPSSFILTNNSTYLTQSHVETLFSDPDYSALTALLNGGNGLAVPSYSTTPSSPVAGQIWLNTGTNSLNYVDKYGATTSLATSAGGGVTSVSSGTGLTGGPITSTGTLSLAPFGTAGSYTKVSVDTYGRVSGGSLIVGNDITSGTISGSTSLNTTGSVIANTVSGNAVAAGALNSLAPLGVTGLSGPPAVSGGSDPNLIFRIQNSANAIDFGVNDSWPAAWIQTRMAAINGTIDNLKINPLGGSVQVGGYNDSADGEFTVFQEGASPPLTLHGLGTSDLFQMQAPGVSTIFNKNGWLGIGIAAPAANLDVNGHMGNSTPNAPTTICSNTSVTSNSNDVRGSIQISSSSPLNCDITFFAPYSSPPTCVVTWSAASPPTTAVAVTTTNTTMTLHFSGSVGGGPNLNYICLQ